MSNDILDDLKRRLIEVGFNNPTMEKVVMETRRDWAGDKVYINYSYTQKNKARDEAVWLDYDNGSTPSVLSKKFKITRQGIVKILKKGGRWPQKVK